ncbi:hypothetical protein SPRG_20676 [Saprolegnia parasitica CBS 223.65]|uniref:Uncharacterized protein n=1 Tax=Saprolegnia parasitica (strain CBS 223.65) TaxID=695850 RepID=A0A067C4V9_SAPPC|nr:hypothetical protein SPRG_20676 [Saprolegnia parasitica CBS 223.65]KDO25558.1 hypothetical protein SPRG_20676 [Saprolegnia parasitica CBS 223.65]|eukprot:XP_012203779.1 hypothetical protein SPRG_20676 [Saprolegnia parasitica CBS 223.65]
MQSKLDNVVALLRSVAATDGLLIHGVDLRLCIDGVPDAAASDVGAILAVYPTGVLPTDKFKFRSDMYYEAYEKEDMRRAVNAALKPSGPFHVVLSHIAIERADVTPPTTPLARAEGSFATLLVVHSSSVAGGGDVAATLDTVTTTSTLEATSYFAYYNDCTVAKTPITRGTRVMLVFDLVYNDPTQLHRSRPMSLAAQYAELQALMTPTRQAHSLYAVPLCDHYDDDDGLDFDELPVRDMQLIERLLAADCVDVALVFAKEPEPAPGRHRTDSNNNNNSDFSAHDRDAILNLLEGHGLHGAGLFGDEHDDDEDDESDGEDEDDDDDDSEDGNDDDDDDAIADDDMSNDDDIDDPNDDGDEDEDDEDGDSEDDDEDPLAAMYDDARPQHIIEYVFPPSSPTLPKVFHDMLLHKPVLRRLKRTAPLGVFISPSAPTPLIVFWPVHHRLRLLGFRAALAQLGALVSGTSKDLYGYASVLAFANAVVDMVGRAADVGLLHDNRNMPDVVALGRLLLRFGNVQLLQNVVGHAMDLVDFTFAGDALRALIVDMIQSVGWEPLYLSLQMLLSKPSAELKDLVSGAALITSLLPIAQPFMYECIQGCYFTLLAQLVQLQEDDCLGDDEVDLLVDLLRIETHVASDLVTSDGAGAFLGDRLPVGILQTIASFAKPVELSTLVTTILPTTFDPIDAIAAAVVRLQDELPAAALQPYLTLVETTVASTLGRKKSTNEHDPSAWAYCLALLVDTASFPSALQQFVDVAAPSIVLSTLQSFLTHSSVPPSTATAMADNIVRAVATVCELPFDATPYDPEALHDAIVDAWNALDKLGHGSSHGPAIVDAVLAFWATVPHEKRMTVAMDVVAKWFLKATSRDVMRPVVVAVVPVLDGFVATLPRPRPPSWALTSFNLPCACAQCSSVLAFARDPSQGIFQIPDGHTCLHFHGLIERRDPFQDIEVRYPMNGGLALYKDKAQAVRDYKEAHDVLQAMHAMLPPTTNRPAKRQRRNQ